MSEKITAMIEEIKGLTVLECLHSQNGEAGTEFGH